MAKETERPEGLKREMSDYRNSEIAQPCMHCKHKISIGSQFSPEGWTCKAFPKQIPYSILTLREPHSIKRADPQVGDYVFDPVIYTEGETGREWHYTAEGRWVYLDGGPK